MCPARIRWFVREIRCRDHYDGPVCFPRLQWKLRATELRASEAGLSESAERAPLRAPAAPSLTRESIAAAFLRGEGVELGALHKPLPLPEGAHVRYVDRLDKAGLRRHYPELAALPLVPVDVVDDGETLGSFADGSLDFVSANHFLEHAENPLGALTNMLRVLRPGGTVLLAIPDKRLTFDRDRPVTPFSHLERDEAEGPEWSRRQHYEEWARLVRKLPSDEEVSERIERYLTTRYSIHFHVWTDAEMLELFSRLARQPATLCCVEVFARLGEEYVAVLRKGGPAANGNPDGAGG